MNLTAYLELCKPKIVLMLGLTALVGMLLSVNFYTNIFPGLISLVGFILLASSSAAFNQIFDKDLDKNMVRTKNRPVASGALKLSHALVFSFLLFLSGCFLLYQYSNILTLSLTVFGFVFYGIVYTLFLKWSTPQNIVIGGFSGALPPLIGWTAINNEISLMPIILVAVIFLWTPPHFWPLAIHRIEDYKKEKVPMMPVAKGIKRTKVEMVIYALLLTITSTTPYFYGLAGEIYFFSTLALNLIFLFLCFGYLTDQENKKSMQIFNFSVWYMFLFFSMTYIDFLIYLDV